MKELSCVVSGTIGFVHRNGLSEIQEVAIMHRRFWDNNAFEQPIDVCDNSSVANMGSMFRGNSAFNQSIGDCNTPAVPNMGSMFSFHPSDRWL